MKIAITSTKKNLNSKIDPRFGRCSYFCIYDIESGTVKFIENEEKEARGGAGTSCVERMAELDVKRVISRDFGPKAKSMLNQLGIQMVIIKEDKTITEIIDKIK